MPSNKSQPPPANDALMHNTPGGKAHGAEAGDAESAWTALVDGWWHQQSQTLPEEFRRAMQAMLDQSKAVWALAGDSPVANVTPTEDHPDGGTPAAPAAGLWQPIFEALRTCEQNVLSGLSDPARSQEYAAAYGAYVGEFAKLNLEVTRRIKNKLTQLDTDVDFAVLQRLILEEAEDTYLSYVSTDEFARCQAHFINALFRHLRASQYRKDPGSEE